VKIELYEQVALRRDFPEYGLKQGDLATLVDYVPHPHGGEEGCILEVFNAVGDSIAVIVVPVSAIETLHPNEILSVRAFAS
jgi:hypothetical protein